MALPDVMSPIDVERMRCEFNARDPIRWICVDDLLMPDFADEVASSFPSFEKARSIGREFRAVNESGKVQVTDPQHFPEPVRHLWEVLASDEWLATVAEITGIRDLETDESLQGGACTSMGPDHTSTCTSISISCGDEICTDDSTSWSF